MVEFFGGDHGDSGRGHWLRLFETHSQQEEGSYFRSWQKRREARSERRVRNEGSAGAWECLQGKGIYFLKCIRKLNRVKTNLSRNIRSLAMFCRSVFRGVFPEWSNFALGDLQEFKKK